MPRAITIPRLGWSMEEGTFREWLKPAGALIAAGELLYVLEGDKAAHDIEALDSGILCLPTDGPRPGEVVRVGQVIGFLLAESETPPASVGTHPITSASASTVTQENLSGGEPQPAPTAERFAVATPRARRRARDLNVDWKPIPGTGRAGRIRERDVVAFVTSRDEFTRGVLPVGRHQPMSRIRQTIAQRMLAGVQQTAPVTLMMKADASGLVRWRTQYKACAGQAPTPGYQDLIIKLAASLLPTCPLLNACCREEGIFVYDAIHMGLAVDTEAGLLAPVLRDADKLSVVQIAERTRALIDEARLGTLGASELQGGTFTVTNLGMFGIDFFTPVLNVSQSAILGLGRLTREPVVRGESLEIGETMGLSLTFDHRVLDGAPASRWLQQLAESLRDPVPILGAVPADVR